MILKIDENIVKVVGVGSGNIFIFAVPHQKKVLWFHIYGENGISFWEDLAMHKINLEVSQNIKF